MRNLQHSAFGLASDSCCLLQIHIVGRDCGAHMTLGMLILPQSAAALWHGHVSVPTSSPSHGSVPEMLRLSTPCAL